MSPAVAVTAKTLSTGTEGRTTMLRSLTISFALALVLLAFSASAQGASPAWKGLGFTGPTHLPPQQSETQRLAVDADGGSYTLTHQAQTTVPIAFDASASVVEAALDALPGVDVAVSGGPGGAGLEDPYFVTFGGGLANTDVAALTANDAGLTGDGSESVAVATTVPGGPGTGSLGVFVVNVGGAASSGPMTMKIGPLPTGMVISGLPTLPTGWACTPAAGEVEVTCTYSPSVAPGINLPAMRVSVTVGASAAASSSVPVSLTGGGVGPGGSDEFEIPVIVSTTPAPAGVRSLWAGAFDADGQPYAQAGGHPASAGSFFQVNTVRVANGRIVAAGDPRDIEVEVPPGFVGNPQVTERCPTENLICLEPGMPGDDAVVGRIAPSLFDFGNSSNAEKLYNDVPRFGELALFTFLYIDPELSVVASLRSDRDYGVTVSSPNTPYTFKFYGALAMLDGFPVGGDGAPFLSNPTGCSDEAQGTPLTTVAHNTWQAPSLVDRFSVEVPKVVGCDQLEFGTPDVPVGFAFQPSAQQGASAAGATADLQIDQDGLLDPDGLATPHLKRSVVTLPDGLVLNPSAANGLEACSTEQIGLMGTDFAMPNPIRFDRSAPRCPDGSKVGTVAVETPLLDDTLEGTVYLAEQGDNPFGSLLALYLVIDNDRYGLTIKLPGRVDPDPETGRLTATFDHNPQLPFSNLKLQFRGGSRGTLATPDVCGSYSTAGEWTPWSAPDSGPPAQTTDAFSVSGGCAPSKAQRPFDLALDAGSTNAAGGSFSPFTLRLTRGDGSQELDVVEARAPQGLLASLKGVPYCPEGAITQAIGRTARGTGALEQAMPSCPDASRVGTTSVGAGVGPSPYFAGGKLYLAGPYKGAPLSLVIVVPAVAGPFDLGVQVVRTALHIDRSTAQVTAVSDTVPKILEGVPLAIQDVRVNLDRSNFTINPTSCEAKQVATTVTGANGASRTLGSPFHASGCAKLAFKPKLRLRLTGRRQVTTGKHPGIRAQVNQTGVGEAGIEKAEVRLPRSLALDPNNAQALCEFEDGTKPDLENHCPKGSIVGRAKAVTPLLDQPLAGNVYFVKNVRTDPKTGNQIRTLPMIIVALRGQVPINLKGESSTTRSGKLVSTFANVPDAPITRFNLNIQGGNTGILAVTRTARSKINLCTGRHIAESDMDGHNGRRHDTNIRMKTPCTKRQTRAAKRKAKRAAAKRSAHRR
jgi:hypothetical protein